MRTNFAINISKDKIHKISVSFVTKFTMKYEILLILLPKILCFKKRFIYCLSNVWASILCITLAKLFHEFVGS